MRSGRILSSYNSVRERVPEAQKYRKGSEGTSMTVKKNEKG
jgi:hypothetical protein